MPERKPNRAARIAAVIALMAAFALVTFTLFTAGSDSGGNDGNGGGDGGNSVIGEPTRKGEKALARGYYVVQEGDTLAQIAEDTGFELDELVELNPQLDPQALIAGERVRLR